jgi:hypothetical protein
VRIPFAHPVQFCFLLPVLSVSLLMADPMPVRQVGGAIHGLAEMRGDDGRVMAWGELTRVVRSGNVTSRVTFHFKDGSIDDETTVYSQRRTLQLISDHHVQKGPSFPHPIDVLIDARTGEVTVHATGKDGKEEVRTEHLDLPPDLANGMMPVVAENLRPGATTTLSMVVTTPKPRLVKLVISYVGEDRYFLAGFARKALHYEIKIDLGGVAGVVAPIIGKEPPKIEVWTIGGAATTFAREIGPLYPEGPMVTIQPASPVWPSGETAEHKR